MKSKMLKGTVNNLCDSLSSPMFYTDKELLKKYSSGDRWKIDLKKGVTFNQSGRRMSAVRLKEYYKWFLNELKNAGIPLSEIERAEAEVVFAV